MQEDRSGLHAHQVDLDVVLFQAILQNNSARLQEVLVLCDDLLWHPFEALMHRSECQLSLLPVFVVAFLHHDLSILLEKFSRHSEILFGSFEATVANVHNTELLASGQHLS